MVKDPLNHRVFERKLHPKPWSRARLLGCHATSPPHPLTCARRGGGGECWPPVCALPARSWLKRESPAPGARASSGHSRPHPMPCTPGVPWVWTLKYRPCGRPRNATPGQARLPAEFRHINKRRKRNRDSIA
ncbi:hypothetical protein SLA2020_073700 [Shorea laevis]